MTGGFIRVCVHFRFVYDWCGLCMFCVGLCRLFRYECMTGSFVCDLRFYLFRVVCMVDGFAYILRANVYW